MFLLLTKTTYRHFPILFLLLFFLSSYYNRELDRSPTTTRTVELDGLFDVTVHKVLLEFKLI